MNDEAIETVTYFEAFLGDTVIVAKDGATLSTTCEQVTEISIPVDCGVYGDLIDIRIRLAELRAHIEAVDNKWGAA